ncbi:preprotein translocase subunit SecG [Thalassotalea ponticola]|uniref:preprotein translocase subunit SecG n=1 Tax=Thalassotalea ponticola TaxID=1523392 RepID=UPI0025B41EDF|nr:preprotein translocase subunit SecG [Thalassotalea ponticola]MDN3651170.1 preprotein translocase subunit SecG [Thalassotalea ponticola]
MYYQIFLVIYLIIALVLVGFILLQQGKGADMGASFGAGSSATIFGSSGSGNFMTKTTTILATCFFLISLVLGNLTAQRTKATDEWNNLGGAEQVESATPASDVPVSDDKKENDVPN